MDGLWVYCQEEEHRVRPALLIAAQKIKVLVRICLEMSMCVSGNARLFSSHSLPCVRITQTPCCKITQ